MVKKINSVHKTWESQVVGSVISGLSSFGLMSAWELTVPACKTICPLTIVLDEHEKIIIKYPLFIFLNMMIRTLNSSNIL